MKGIIVKELFIARKRFCITAATYFTLMLMWILVKMSCLYGNIGKYAGKGADEAAKTTYYFAVFGMLVVLIGFVINNTGSDIVSRWNIYQKTLPMTSKQLVGAVYLANAVTISAAVLTHLLMTFILCAIFGIGFKAFYLEVFAAFAVIVFFFNAMSLYPFYRFRSVKKGKLAASVLLGGIYVGLYIALYFFTNSSAQKAHEEISRLAQEMNVKISKLPVTEDKLAEEYLLRDLGKLTDTLLDFRWLFLIGAALLTAGVFFMSAKALDRPMDDTKPAENGEKGAVS